MAFPTTHWSVLAEATLHGDSAGRAALARICDDYRGPVVTFLQTRGYSPHASDDAAQEYFLHLLRSGAWKRANRARGRFRTFLLGALMHVLEHTRQRDQALKRGSGFEAESLDALLEIGFEPPAITVEAVRIFDREWALQLIEGALTALQLEVAARDAGDARFAVLKRFLPGADQPLSYEEAAQRLGISLATTKTWIHRSRLRFRELLRAAVAATVSAPHEIDEELLYLRTVLTGAAETSRPGIGRRS